MSGRWRLARQSGAPRAPSASDPEPGRRPTTASPRCSLRPRRRRGSRPAAARASRTRSGMPHPSRTVRTRRRTPRRPAAPPSRRSRTRSRRRTTRCCAPGPTAWWRPVVGVLIALLGRSSWSRALVLCRRSRSGSPRSSRAATASTTSRERRPRRRRRRGPAGAQPRARLDDPGHLVRRSGVVHRMRPRWLTSVVPQDALAVLLRLPRAGRRRPASPRSSSAPSAGRRCRARAQASTTSPTTTALASRSSCCSPRRSRRRGGVPLPWLPAAGRRVAVARTMVKWVAIVLTALLFALAHGAQNFPLFFDRFAFGLDRRLAGDPHRWARGRHRAARA